MVGQKVLVWKLDCGGRMEPWYLLGGRSACTLAKFGRPDAPWYLCRRSAPGACHDQFVFIGVRQGFEEKIYLAESGGVLLACIDQSPSKSC